jgi:two-component system, LytTR family, response regulator AlgR
MNASVQSVLIVDDEPPARDRLERLVADLPDWQVAGSCANAAEALELAARLSPAVVLLDIEMPGMDGIDAARSLGRLEPAPAVIFTTAYDRYALDAFDSRAVGYLLKPVRRDRLAEALQHARRFVTPDAPAARARHLVARADGGLKRVPLADVLYLLAERKCVSVRHVGGQAQIGDSLLQIEAEHGATFVRLRRDLLVNAERIDTLQPSGKRGHVVRLRGLDEPLPVSRRQLAELRRRLVKRKGGAGLPESG